MNLPYYKTEKSFQRFTKLIGKAVDIYPAAFDYVPDVALETFNRDFRYAIKSALEFGYTSPNINMQRFHTIGDTIRCVMRNGCVLIGHESGIKMLDGVRQASKPTKTFESSASGARPEIEFCGTSAMLQQLIVTIHQKVFIPMPVFVISFTTEAITELADTYDLAIELHPTQPGKWRIL
jgi:hypothetical protein